MNQENEQSKDINLEQLQEDEFAYKPSSIQEQRLNRLLDILTIFRNNNINAIVSGGYGLDGLYGRLTRDHDDIDLFIQSDQIEKASEILASEGYTQETQDGRIIFIHPDDDLKIEITSTDVREKYSEAPEETFFPEQPNASINGIDFKAVPLAGAKIIGLIHDEQEKKYGWQGYPEDKRKHKDLLIQKIEEKNE